ncbi:MaoC family dehydratase [Labrys neptuniae]
MTVVVGQVAEHTFTISDGDMRAFQELSGDHSSIHTDAEYARSRGFRDVIVYGGIVLAKLSFLLGKHIPGDRGVSTRWTIDYRRPLYVDEEATIKLEVQEISTSTGLIDSKFWVRTADRLIATGKTQSILPLSELGSSGIPEA